LHGSMYCFEYCHRQPCPDVEITGLFRFSGNNSSSQLARALARHVSRRFDRCNYRCYFRYFFLIFMPVQLITAAVTGLLFRKSVLANPASCWWQALIISLPGTIVSTVITISIFHGITSSGSSLIVQLLTGIGMNQAFAVFIVQVATDYLDRLLSILLVSLTLRIGGKRLSSLWQ